jgi:hypothetical protein
MSGPDPARNPAICPRPRLQPAVNGNLGATPTGCAVLQFGIPMRQKGKRFLNLRRLTLQSGGASQFGEVHFLACPPTPSKFHSPFNGLRGHLVEALNSDVGILCIVTEPAIPKRKVFP